MQQPFCDKLDHNGVIKTSRESIAFLESTWHINTTIWLVNGRGNRTHLLTCGNMLSSCMALFTLPCQLLCAVSTFKFSYYPSFLPLTTKVDFKFSVIFFQVLAGIPMSISQHHNLFDLHSASFKFFTFSCCLQWCYPGTLYITGQKTPRITAQLTLTSGLARGPWRHAAANK